MTKNCIISFANKKNRYVQNLARLSESLRNNFVGDFLGFIGEESCGAQPHLENPYNFKIHCIQKAIDRGYEKILWLDSSCFAIKNVQPIFSEIEKNTFIFQDSGHWLGSYSTDACLEYHGITRDEAMEVRMIGNAGFLGFDFMNGLAREFFDRWKKTMEKGLFLGKWNNDDKSCSLDERCLGARHDMSNSSALVYKMGLTHLMKSGEEWLQYAGMFDETINDTIILKAQG